MTAPGIDLHISLGQLLMSVVGGFLAWCMRRVYRRIGEFLDQWDYVLITSGAAYKVVSTKYPMETGEAVTHFIRKRGRVSEAANGRT